MAKLTPTAWIWRDGEFIPWDDAHVHVLTSLDAVRLLGLRRHPLLQHPRGPAIFRLEDHLQRLLDSCRDLPHGCAVHASTSSSRRLLRAGRARTASRRATSGRWSSAASARPGMVPFDSPVEVYLPCWPWGAYLGDGALENGVDACISSWNRVAPNTIPAMAKIAGNYLSGQLIKMEALANGFAEGDRARAGRPGERGVGAERLRRSARRRSTRRRSTARCWPASRATAS